MRRTIDLLARRLSEPAYAVAALRIAVAGIILLSPELRRAAVLAADPFQTDVIPEGLHMIARLPLSAVGARVLQLVAVSSAVTALLGYGSRFSLLVLTLSGGLTFSLSQRSGAVIHDMHLFWFTALLAASRCGDVWALDAWGKPRPPPSLAYGVPAAIARTLLGFVYFFPGVHKVLGLGFRFLTAEHQINEMHAKWFQFGRVPFVRIDHFPVLCTLGAALVVFFELSFLFLVQLRRTRLFAAGLGALFHLGTGAFFFIHFPSLWVCLVLLLPFGAPKRDAAEEPSSNPRAEPEPWSMTALLVGFALAVPVVVQGVRGKTQAWPFACYPTFAVPVSDTLVDLNFEVTHPNGRVEHFSGREHEARSQFEWRRVFYLANASSSADNDDARAEFAEKMARRAGVALDSGARLRVLRAEYLTAPEAWGRPALRVSELLAKTITR